MSGPVLRGFKLAGPEGDGRHAYVNKDGAFIGRGVPLLEHDSFGQWQPRGNAALERLLGKGYGIPITLGWRATQLRYVAQALNRGDLALACISLVRAELPPLPSADHARLMAKADSLLVKYNPDWEGEPRVPEGDPAGGQWSGEDEDGAGGDRTPLTFVSDGGASTRAKASARSISRASPNGSTGSMRRGRGSWAGPVSDSPS